MLIIIRVSGGEGRGKIQISELAVPGFELEGGKGLDYNASSADDSRSTYKGSTGCRFPASP